MKSGVPKRARSSPIVAESSCMPCGGSYSMMISSMHTLMGLLFAALMGLNDGFTLASSHTLLTTLKSMFCLSPICRFLIHSHLWFYDSCRILLATIQHQGLCPCPRCLVLKSNTDKVGLVADTKTCIEKAHKYLADAVNEARKAIYMLGLPIGGAAVERLLKPTSSVPMKVCSHLNHNYII